MAEAIVAVIVVAAFALGVWYASRKPQGRPGGGSGGGAGGGGSGGRPPP